MSQTLAHLIKNKIFQGNNTTVPSDDERKKNRRWGHKKEDTEVGFESSPSKLAEAGLQFPMSPLNSIGEESKSIDSVSEADGVSESEGEGVVEERSEEEEFIPGSPESKDNSEKRRGKLQLLRSKMSIPDLSFKPNKLYYHHKQHRRQRSAERSPTLSQENSPNSVPVSPGSVGRDVPPLQRPSYERSASGLGSIYKLGSNSSTSSSRFFYSPRRPGNNAAHLSSNSNNNTQTSVVSSKASSGSNLFNTSSSTQHLMRGHVRNSSVEMKSVKPQPISIGRRRSKTLDTYGDRDHRKGCDTTSDLLNSINVHLSSSRSNSVKSRSPSLKTQDTGAGASTAVATVCHNSSPSGAAPLKFSNGSGTIPFPTVPGQSQQPTMSRRGSSIANALNSFVNLRSFSNSSSKGTSTANTTKVELPGEELPPAPEPEAEEGYMDYLTRLSPYGKAMGVILCENDEPFKRECLHHFLMNYFDFRQCPLDIALRIMLMFLELPKEAQQIDRLLIEFSKVYYGVQCESEPACTVWVDESQVYFVAFSLLILHTDYFNPKNRFKMTKHEFANLILEDGDSHGCKMPREILSYFYDNITAKEFTKFEFVPHSTIQPFDTTEQESGDSGDSRSVKFYSPVDIIRTQGSPSSLDLIPLANVHTGRTSSNSFSSYLPHVPVSTSGSNISLVQDDVDIYSHIFDDSLSSLSMAPLVQKNRDEEYMHGIFADDNKYNKYFSILREAKGGYLRLHRQDLHKLAFPVYEILNISEADADNLYLKIIQMGEIDELTLNRKFTIVGASNKTMWKRLLGILTTCGLLMFDNQDWVNPRLIKDESTGTSNYIIDYNSSASMTVESPIPVRGLLAVNKSHKLLRQALGRAETIEDENESRTSSLSNVTHVDEQCKETNNDCIMRLYGSQKAKVWRCSSQYEKENWIDAINLMAAYDGCFINSKTVKNTVVSSRKHSVKERVNKLILTGLEKQRKLEESQNVLGIYAQTMPICTRTKNELSFHIKQLAVAMEWLVYEIRRSEINLKILEQTGTLHCEKKDQNRDGHEEDEDEGDQHSKEEKRTEETQHERQIEPEVIGAISTDHPFVFDERLMHRNFAKDQSAIYDQTEVNKGGILATY